MSKINLFNDDDSWSPEGTILADKLTKLIKPLIKEYNTSQYRQHEVENIINTVVSSQIIMQYAMRAMEDTPENTER